MGEIKCLPPKKTAFNIINKVSKNMEYQVRESNSEQGIRVVCHYLTGNSNSYKEIDCSRSKEDFTESNDIMQTNKDATIFQLKSDLIKHLPENTVRFYFRIHKYAKFTMVKSEFESETEIIHR